MLVNDLDRFVRIPGVFRRFEIEQPSLGELKVRHREEHLCLKCSHHLVCGMAKALDPNLLVTIASCLGFEPVESEEAPCEGR